jgi:hypothetical protein
VLEGSLSGPGEDIRRDYNRRANMKNRIADLKHDLGADRFCLEGFHFTGAVFRNVLRTAETQREPGTLRSAIFLGDAELSQQTEEIVLSLSRRGVD